MVLQNQAGDFDRILNRDVLEQLGKNSLRSIPEPAIALAVHSYIGRSFIANWQGRRAPDDTGVLITEIDGFAGRIRHGIIRPGSELILAAVAGPGVAGTGF